jgi:serine/threonine protein kinase
LQPIPGHRLTQLLGRGGFGEVWEAIDGEGRAVALKFLDCRSRTRDLVSSEVRILRGLEELQHPNIIRLHGVHASSRYLILAMERADGNLADLRSAYQEEAGVNIPSEHALELLDQAAAALDFLAELRLPGFNSGSRGLQHCDVKPSNLLLVGDVLKVADFGLCAATSWHPQGAGWRGTLPYAAPELARGAGTLGTDQYALAVTFCELVMGERAFLPGARSSDIPRVGPPIDLTRIRERELLAISRALHPQPSARWPSCRAFVAALREAGNCGRGPVRPRRRSSGRLQRLKM